MTPQQFALSSQNNGEEVEEATKLPAQTRELKGQELKDYLDRIRGKETGEVDKREKQSMYPVKQKRIDTNFRIYIVLV